MTLIHSKYLLAPPAENILQEFYGLVLKRNDQLSKRYAYMRRRI
jgi:hypothetical protein